MAEVEGKLLTCDDGGEVSEILKFGISSSHGSVIDAGQISVPNTLVIDMAALDEISERARGFKEIVLRLDGKEHRYRPDDVLEILRGIEL